MVIGAESLLVRTASRRGAPSYGLTIDPREAPAFDRTLAGCASTALEPVVCAEARRHEIAPLRRSPPAYQYMSDGDGDGVVCE